VEVERKEPDAFDAHHPPDPRLIDDCVHCGFCLPACPTYALWGEEMDSPRGRIYLMKLGTEGGAQMTPTFVEHFDRCLGCMACMPACPSGVQYGRLVEATRAQIERRHRRPAGDRLLRALVFALFPRPRRLRLLRPALWLYRRAGLGALARLAGALKLLPARLAALDALAPDVGLRAPRVPAVTPAQGSRRGRVGLLLGCVQREFFAETNAATARVLAAEGFEVVAPREQGCCGALFVHSGREREALACARRLVDAFDGTDVDAIVVNAAGCGSTMKEYGHLLRDDPRYAARAEAFAAKCRDVAEVLAAAEPAAPLGPVRMRVAYHDACHLRHAQGVAAEPRAVLARVPGLEVVEVPEGAMCCGSAGIYNIVQPETAAELGDRKAANILATGADAVVTSNPGCVLQIRAALARAGKEIPVLHLVDVLDAARRDA
jgi:glycolate oxidase iron-sulfur subunit